MGESGHFPLKFYLCRVICVLPDATRKKSIYVSMISGGSVFKSLTIPNTEGMIEFLILTLLLLYSLLTEGYYMMVVFNLLFSFCRNWKWNLLLKGLKSFRSAANSYWLIIFARIGMREIQNYIRGACWAIVNPTPGASFLALTRLALQWTLLSFIYWDSYLNV